MDTLLKFTCQVPLASDAELIVNLLESLSLASSWELDKGSNLWQVEILTDLNNEVSITTSLDVMTCSLGFTIYAPKLSVLTHRDWLKENQESFPPLEIGEFYIYGSHIHTPNPGQRLPLKIDAATAFGSGNHGSTQGCLEALSYLQATINPMNILDMGCGSGILAMAASKLWPRANVLAVDIDPECVRVTTDNCRNNDLTQINVKESNGMHTPVIDEKKPFDLIIANILANVVRTMAPKMKDSLSINGTVILSGILVSQSDAVIETYGSLGFSLQDPVYRKDDWVTLILIK